MIDQLINIISKEAALFENFLDLLEQQKQALVKSDQVALAALTERQHEKLAESRLLSRRREELVAAIKREHDIDGDVTVSRLIAMVDQDKADRLRQLRDAIMSLNDQIVQVRNSNAMLLNQSREYVARTMAMLSQLNNPDPGYGKSGPSSNPSRALALDRRA
jgi:flagellar biosynthesis/type III secretory pathway chaperone